jgi:hypothetical protein
MPIHDWSRVDEGLSHDLHLGWIDELRGALNQRLLPEPFYALAEPVLGDCVPDVLTLRGGEALENPEAPAGLRDDASESPVASTATVVVQDLPPPEFYSALARHIVVRNTLRDDEVVAVIELVSRANKSARERRDQFVTRSVGLLRSGIHLVVVDIQAPTTLVPHGFHALICDAHGCPSAELPEDRNLQALSYQVLEDRAVRSHVVPLRVGDALPEMPAFLTPHHYVRVPIEEAYVTAFARLPRRFREVLEA